MASNNLIYEEITNNILTQLASGTIPWTKPWICSNGIVSHATGKPYSLLNAMLLQRPGEYVTYKQAEAEGGHVKKGAKSRHVYFWKSFLKKEVTHDSNGFEVVKEKQIPLLKTYCVFHISDCEGLNVKYAKDAKFDNDPIISAEKIVHDYVQRENISLRNDAVDEAFFSPSRDLVQVPPLTSHKSAEEYYSTMFHELTHSSGIPKRLNRFEITDKDPSEYAKEELVAELGAALMLAELGIQNKKVLANSAAYCQSWLKRLSDDPSMIVTASSKAEKAVKFILGKAD